MKRALWLAVVLAAVWGLPRLSHPAVDIGKLEPVETVLLILEKDGIRVETDTGAVGFGDTLEDSVEKLRRSSATEVYLDTTSKLLVAGEAGEHWKDVMDFFRPSCVVCLADEGIDLEQATEYLSVHKPEMTLNRLRAGERNWQRLYMEEGRGRLEPE